MFHVDVIERSMRYVAMWKCSAVNLFLNALTQASNLANCAAVLLLRCAAPDEVFPTAAYSCRARVPPVSSEQRASPSYSSRELLVSSVQRVWGQRHRLRPHLRAWVQHPRQRLRPPE
jgi:hypothetical protein